MTRALLGGAALGAIALLATPAQSGSPDAVPRELGLSTCMYLSATGNPSVLAARKRLEASRSLVRARRADRVPDLTLRDTHSRTNRDFPAFFSQPRYAHQITAALEQRVYSGGALPASVRLAESGVRESEGTYLLTIETVLGRVVEAFLKVHEETRTQEVLEESIQTHRHRISDIQARIDAGVLLETDRLQADLQLLEDERALVVSRTAELLARDTLRVLLDLSSDSPARLTSDLAPIDSIPVTGIEDETRLEGAPALQVRDARVRQARARVDLARAASRPSVDLKVQQVHIANGLSVFSQDADYAEAMGVLELPIFDGGGRRARLEQAEAELEAAILERRVERDELVIRLGEAILGIREAQARLRSAETRLDLARANRDIVQERYLQGTAIQAELLDADVSFRLARLDQVRSRFDILRNVARSLGLSGGLAARTLVDHDLGADPTLEALIRPRILAEEAR